MISQAKRYTSLKNAVTGLVFLLTAPLPTTAAPPPQTTAVTAAAPVEHHAYTAIYQAVFKGFPLQATHRLEKSGNDWFFSSIASGFFGQIEENSTFTFTSKGIVPLHYLYQRSVLGHESENEITYNQVDKIASSSKGDKTYTVKLNGDELDQGTYTTAMRDDLARGINEPCYKVVDGDEIENFCFRNLGHETIDTALGKLDTVVLERVRKPTSPRRTRYWFAPSLDYTIAKLEHQEVKNETAYSLEITYYHNDKDGASSHKK
ncbi:MAG TPA: DUF3108 domain-containing protein [Pseudomonadales bacterium]|nr:DUF3108 domain-containing protein [Pseudomonadales bacterium]